MPDTGAIVIGMFDTMLGLPVHALVVHAVVVLVPLMAVVTTVVALAVSVKGAGAARDPGATVKGGWATALAWPVALVNVALAVLTFVARESGRTLQDRFGGQTALEHGELGERLPWFVLALAATSLAVAVLLRWPHREPTRERPAGWVLKAVAGLTVATAVATTGWVVVVGHSGTQSVWQERVEFSNTR